MSDNIHKCNIQALINILRALLIKLDAKKELRLFFMKKIHCSASVIVRRKRWCVVYNFS